MGFCSTSLVQWSWVYNTCMFSHRYDSRNSILEWSILLIDNSNRSGSMDFVVPPVEASVFFPISVRFTAASTFSELKVLNVLPLRAGPSPRFAQRTLLSTENYQVLITRSDDTEAVVQERLRIYNEKVNKPSVIFIDEIDALATRGQDTRKAFTDHLYTSLVQAGFRTFKDDDDIERGENIKLELHKAIRLSRISVVVFSKEYASSRWCLDELLMILECKRTSKHMVLPVFYDVDPSQVKNQTEGFAEAFARHENIEAENDGVKNEWMHKAKEWRAALREVTDLGGMVLQNQVDGYGNFFCFCSP
ncbi:hypothetical protein ACSBR1_019004 [Camellia fascicularis]